MLTERGTDRRRRRSCFFYSQGSPNRGCARRSEGLTRIRRSLVATAIVAMAGVVLASCGDASKIMGPGKAVTPGAPAFLVTTSPEVTETVPIETADPCTGELVQGTLETRMTFDVDDETPHITLHMKFRFSGNGIKEVTDDLGIVTRQTTGTEYTGSGEFNDVLNANTDAEKLETGFTQDFRIFAKNYALGEAMDDFMSHWNVHATVFLVPPRTTSEVNNFFFECK